MNQTNEHPIIARPEDYALGETREELYVETLEHNRAAARLLLEQTKFRYYILDRDLDPDLYSSRELAESLSRLCRRGRHTDVRILIADNRKLIHQTHFLLGTIRQFSSYIQLRRLPRKYMDLEQNFVLADDSGVLTRQRHDAYVGKLYFHNPALHKELREEFNHLWEHCDPDPDVRQLSY